MNTSRTVTTTGRRRFMLSLSALTGSLFTFSVQGKDRKQDIPLREADFYRPHNRAG